MKTSLTSLRVILLLLGLMISTTACLPFVGDGPEDENATPTPGEIPTVIPVTRPTQEASASPVPTIIVAPSPAAQATSPPPACTPRNDWPVYTVQSGDTLYSIAIRSDSTVNAIQAANCLPDPDRLVEGQSLRVPQEPESQEPEPEATPAPAATQAPFFQGTATPVAPPAAGDVTFTFVAANNTATKVSEGVFQATADPVEMSVSVTNVVAFDIVLVDGRVLHRAQAPEKNPNAGGTFDLRKLDALEGQQSLFIYVRATRPNGSTIQSDPIRITWL